MEKQLKPRQEYIDRYDRMTVERCRWAEKAITPADIQKHSKENIDESEGARMTKAFNDLHLWFVAGEYYSKKEETISEWMSKDEERDRFYESSQAPKGIACLTCGRDMYVTFKQLDTHLDKPDRVLFMYDCTLGHIPRRAFYDNGEEWKYEKPKCLKCQAGVEVEDKSTEEKHVTVYTCAQCGHVEVSEFARTVGLEKVDPDFEKDRARFCNPEEGRKYVEWVNTAKEITAVLEKQKEKEAQKDLYDKVAKIKRLKIIELEQLLVPVFEKEGYIKLHFKDPEVTRDVVVPFIVHDSKTGREERASSLELQRLIKKTLEGTNWRLMSEGVSYRLGMLDGRFRAYENEEDLVKLLKNQ